MNHAPVGPAGGVQDFVMLLQDFAEPGKVQVLWKATRGRL